MRKGWIGWLAGLALLGCATARAADESPAMAAAPAWVQEEPLPAAPGGNAGLRYELVSDQLDLTGPRPRWFHRVSYTVRRDNALADAGQIGLYYQPDYQSLVLNHLEVWRDGRRIDMRTRAHYARLRREDDLEQGLLDGALTLNVSLPDLRVGDRIDYGYTVTGANPVFGRGYHDSYTARYEVPLGARRLRVRYPQSLPLQWKVSVPGFRVGQRLEGGIAELRLDADALPAVRTEKDTPEGYDGLGRIELSTAADWAAVADWAVALYPRGFRDPAVAAAPVPPPQGGPAGGGRIELSTAADGAAVADWAVALYPRGFRDPAVAAAMTRQLKLDRHDPQGSMQRAIAFVQGDIRYLGLEMGASSHAPHAPEETLRNRYGDCKDKATLLVALLGLAGIPAEPVLVDSAAGADLSARLPSPLAFDHVVVRARPPGQVFWIDATRDREYGSFAQRAPLPFGQGLPVVAGQAALVTVPYPVPTVPEVKVVETVQVAMSRPRRQARFAVVTDYLHGDGDDIRDLFETQGADAVGDQYLDYMRRYYTAMELDGAPTLDDADPQRLRVGEAYRLDWHRRDNDVVGFPLFQLQDWMKELPRTERRAPLALGGPRLATQTVRVRSDAGLHARPRTDTIENPWFRFTRRVAMEGGELVIEGEWERRTLLIPPEGLRRAARDMAAARALLSFDQDLRPDPLRGIPASAWLHALGGLGVAGLLLLAATWNGLRGGIGQVLFRPDVLGTRLAGSRALRWQAWLALAITALLSAALYRGGGGPAMLKQLGMTLAQVLAWSLLFWAALWMLGVRIRAAALATAIAAAQLPQLPMVAGGVVATLGAVAWVGHAAVPPAAAWPGVAMLLALALVAIIWTVVALVGVVASASGAPRWRVLLAWLVVFAIGLVLAVGMGLVMLARRGGAA